MIETLHFFVAPVATILFALWAGWLTFAAEADAEVPRILADQQRSTDGRLPPARALHVGHLSLLLLAAASGAIAEAWWARPPLPALSRLLITAGLVWLVGSVLPRFLAAVAPDLPGLARSSALRSLKPLNPLLRLVAWADRKVHPATERHSRGSGAARRDMLLGLFSLADTTVAEVMTPRIDIIAVDASAPRDQVVATLRRSEHARLLVYEEHPDAIVGVLYAKDMLAGFSAEVEVKPWQTLIRPAAFVPEGKTLDRQLRDFQRGPGHLAVVVDEFGGTAGIVTLEDVLEQIVGEIQDEYDTDEAAPVQELTAGRLSVEGGVPLSELEAILGHSFRREDVTTVGGLVLDAFGRVPRSGESIEVDGITLIADQVARRRIRRVHVEQPAASTPAIPNGDGGE